MSKYIGTPVVSLSTDTVDVTGDITTTDATPEVIIINDTHEDTDGGREGKVTFKGQQSGGEETTLAEIQASHDGTSDDEKGDLIFKTNDGSDGASPTERLRINSAGLVHIQSGDSGATPSVHSDELFVEGSGNSGITVGSATNGFGNLRFADSGGSDQGIVQYDHANNAMKLFTDGSERMHIDSDGHVGIGTTPKTDAELITSGGHGIDIESTALPRLRFYNGTSFKGGMEAIQTAGSFVAGSAVNDFGIRSQDDLLFATGGSTERMRILSSGVFLISQTADAFPTAGVVFGIDGTTDIGAATNPLDVNRSGTDGSVIRIFGQGTEEGEIKVIGSTVSLVGGHLSRWSQFTDGSRDTSLLRGTVMTNLDKMAVWSHDAVEAQDTVIDDDGNFVSRSVEAKDAYTEDNEQLNCMAVSSVEGDINVAGIFESWDEEEDGFNDLVVAMTGDNIIRIAKDVTVARGDLLMSAGDGTAKPQDDDIVRSKTIAKVTSTNVSHTYDDESYLVPCVLMAC